MNIMTKILTLSSMILLTGCLGPQASFSERLQDNFLFTSARDVTDSKQCITLTKTFTLKSGMVTYTIPAGQYEGLKENKTGYFYYGNNLIKSSNRLIAMHQQGIYLDKHNMQGNLFGMNPQGYYDRPIRGPVLPEAIFPYIKRDGHC